MERKSHMKMSVLPKCENTIPREAPKQVFPYGARHPSDVPKVRQEQKTRLFFNTKQPPGDTETGSEIEENKPQKPCLHPLFQQKVAFRRMDNNLLRCF